MRILMLSQFYPPIIGGTERHVKNLSIELVKRGHHVAVVTLWRQGMPKYEIDQGVRVHRIQGAIQRLAFLYSESGRRHVPPMPDPEIVIALRNILAIEQPDIVHAHNWLIYSFLPLKFGSQAKLVMTLHDFSRICPQMRYMNRNKLCDGPDFLKCLLCTANHYGVVKGLATSLSHRLMSRTQGALVDMFLPVSHAVALGTQLAKNGLPFEVIPNFVPDDIASAPVNSNIQLTELPNEQYLLFVGDLTRDKGIDVLLKAYSDLVNPPPLVLIGRQCADTPTAFPNNVIVLHDWPHNAVMEAWRRSSVALVPSLCPDACPTVVMEAMAAGKPVIGAKIGGITDLIKEGETGFLVPSADSAALSEAISHLLANSNLCESMGRAAEIRCSEFKASRVVSRIEEIYQVLL